MMMLLGVTGEVLQPRTRQVRHGSAERGQVVRGVVEKCGLVWMPLGATTMDSGLELALVHQAFRAAFEPEGLQQACIELASSLQRPPPHADAPCITHPLHRLTTAAAPLRST